MRRSLNAFLPTLTDLDARLVPAGNILAQLSGGDLALQGDNLGNEVRVSQAANGNVTVRGLNGTTVNGLAQVTYPAAVLNKVEANLEGGNDILTIGSLNVAGDVFVQAGEGNDRVVLNGTISGSLVSVSGGLGADTVRVADVSVLGDMNVNTEDGAGTILFQNATIDGNVSAISLDANDVIRGTNLTVTGDLLVESGKGDDQISFTTATVGFGVTLIGDEGNDRFTLSGVTSDSLSVEAGKGNDIITLTNVSSATNVNVNGDDGNDTVRAQNVTAAFDANFIGGAGFDTLTNLGIFAGVKVDIKEFESVL